jgi:hypothetical protein
MLIVYVHTWSELNSVLHVVYVYTLYTCLLNAGVAALTAAAGSTAAPASTAAATSAPPTTTASHTSATPMDVGDVGAPVPHPTLLFGASTSSAASTISAGNGSVSNGESVAQQQQQQQQSSTGLRIDVPPLLPPPQQQQQPLKAVGKKTPQSTSSRGSNGKAKAVRTSSKANVFDFESAGPDDITESGKLIVLLEVRLTYCSVLL